jgi:DNA-binding NtrC family response regulator
VELVPPPPAEAKRQSTEIVLPLEVEEADRAIVGNALRRSGYHVLDTDDVGEALQQCEPLGARIDLLVTDVVIPHMSSGQRLERPAPLRPHMRGLCMSDDSEDAIIQQRVLDGGIASPAKPATASALLQKAHHMFDAPRRG